MFVSKAQDLLAKIFTKPVLLVFPLNSFEEKDSFYDKCNALSLVTHMNSIRNSRVKNLKNRHQNFKMCSLEF